MSYEHPTHEELVRDALEGLMSNLSEDCWCAYWMHDLEFTLWEAMMTGKTNLGFGVRDCDLVRLKSLHKLAAGWWIWPKDEESKRFVTTEEWQLIFANHAATKTSTLSPVDSPRS
jgi:hypothetical protein